MTGSDQMTAIRSAKRVALAESARQVAADVFESDYVSTSGLDPVDNIGSNVAAPSNSEVCSVASRCSVRLIHEIVSNFSPQKAQLVRSIGFEGILHIPLLKQINLRFSTWLMSRVDELSHTLAISVGSRIKFNKHDVSLVFGIPVGGTSIFRNSGNLLGRIPEVSSRQASTSRNHFRSIKAAQRIIRRDYDGLMSPTEEDECREAFVVFVMSTLLAPSAKHDRVADDFLHAIQNPSEIRSFDWSEYVLRRLLDAVAKLKSDIATGVKAPYIYGCSLFFQVLYLDSIDLGLLSMDHVEFPRIRCFTSDRTRSMIAADLSFYQSGSNIFESRKIKLRPIDGICYCWARVQASNDAPPVQKSRMLALWDLSVTVTRVLRIPPEAAGPLFIAASDYQRKIKCDMCPDALKVMDVFLHLIEPYMNGFSYKPSVSFKSRPIDLCNLGHKFSCQGSNCCYHLTSMRLKRKCNLSGGECSTSSDSVDSFLKRGNATDLRARSSDSFNGGLYPYGGSITSDGFGSSVNGDNFMEDVDIMAINAMARFYLTLNPVKATRCSDLNSTPLAEDRGVGVQLCGGVNIEYAPRAPWEIGFNCTIDMARASDILNKLRFVEDIEEPWIVHCCPKYIEVMTRAIKEQFVGHAEFETELVDAAIRRFKQIDDELYARHGPARWRHFVESDFMVSLLAGCFDIMDPVIREHFCGRHIKYDVSTCRIIFFPVILQTRWVCFAWHMEDNTIVIYDPCTPRTRSSELVLSYERIARLLKNAMCSLSSSILEGWSHDWDHGRLEIFNHGTTYSDTCSANRTGVMCLHFCRCYNGINISPPLEEAQMQDWAASILGDVSLLHGNLGLVPNILR